MNKNYAWLSAETRMMGARASKRTNGLVTVVTVTGVGISGYPFACGASIPTSEIGTAHKAFVAIYANVRLQTGR
jgi:hypothetical protein